MLSDVRCSSLSNEGGDEEGDFGDYTDIIMRMTMMEEEVHGFQIVACWGEKGRMGGCKRQMLPPRPYQVLIIIRCNTVCRHHQIETSTIIIIVISVIVIACIIHKSGNYSKMLKSFRFLPP